MLCISRQLALIVSRLATVPAEFELCVAFSGEILGLDSNSLLTVVLGHVHFHITAGERIFRPRSSHFNTTSNNRTTLRQTLTQRCIQRAMTRINRCVVGTFKLGVSWICQLTLLAFPI